MNATALFPTQRISRTVAVALALLLVSGLSVPAWAITGGEPDEARHPNVGAVIAYYPDYGIVPFCSGTLIHERVFLTAGHCTAAIEAGEVTLLGVSFDEELAAGNPTDPNTWFDHEVEAVTGVYIHTPRGFGASPQLADIGALILEEPVTDIEPAVRPDPGLLDELKEAGQLETGPNGTRLTVVGYGWDLDWPPPEPTWAYEPIEVEYDGQTVLFWGGERNTAQSGYLALNDAWLFLIQNLAVGYGGTGMGDSGGPVFWTNPDTGQEILVSITAWGDLNWVGIGVTYRVDTAESLAFIHEVIDSLDAESP